MREADVSDGTRVLHGSDKHIRDLVARITTMAMWRDKQRRGSESRANYSRLISRLKAELASARRAALKHGKTDDGTALDKHTKGKAQRKGRVRSPDAPSRKP